MAKFAETSQCLLERASAKHLEFNAGRRIAERNSEKAHISRQAVSQLVQTIPARVTDALYDAAKLNGVEPRNIDTAKGILLGYSRELQTNVVITMHPETGLRVWHQHNLGRCKLCSSKKQCKSMLLKTINACGVQLTTQRKTLILPSSQVWFSRRSSVESFIPSEANQRGPPEQGGSCLVRAAVRNT